MCQANFFIRSRQWSRGDQKYPLWIVLGLLSDCPKLTPGGSHSYTLSCKASYKIQKQEISANSENLKLSIWNFAELIIDWGLFHQYQDKQTEPSKPK